MELAIEATAVHKSYGSVQVLNGVDVLVPRGTVFSLLGPNGAGKTTMVRILATLTEADGGSARVAGFDVVRKRRQVRRRISLTGQFAAVDGLQTGEENLRMMGRLLGLSSRAARERATQLLAELDLVDAGRRRVATYSGGMRRRLDLAASLVGQPEVIFLDEPTTGLDPRSRQAVWGLVGGLVDRGVTVFLTTQYLDEADQLADRIAVLDAGRIVAEGTPAQLKKEVAEQRLILHCTDGAAFTAVVDLLGVPAEHSDPERRTVDVATDGSAAHVRSVLDKVDPDGRRVRSFDLHSATLDDVFLALTGHETSKEGSDD
jgi:ABC-2 type transport system ATP-binding protein